jgi:hypothetical protein
MEPVRDYNDSVFELRRKVSNILELNLEELIRERELGHHNLSDAVTPLVEIRIFLDFLDIGGRDDLSISEISSLTAIADRFLSQVQDLRRLTPNDIQTTRGGTISNLEHFRKTTLENNLNFFFLQIIRTLDSNVDKFQIFQEDISILKNGREELNEAIRRSNEENIKSKYMQEQFQRISGDYGVREQAKYFEQAENIYRKSAMRWLSVTGLFSLFLIVFAILSALSHQWPIFATDTPYETAQVIFAKFLVFVVLAFGLALSARNYQSSRHNEVVNRHRKDALSTYEALMLAGATPEARDIILNHAASAIYTLHDTGFAKTKDMTTPNVSPLLAMMTRQTGPTTGGT